MMNVSKSRSRKKSKDTLKQMKMRTKQSKMCGTLERNPLRGKFIALQAYLKKQEKGQINNLISHLKKIEKGQQAKPNVSRRKQIINIRAEIKEIEYKNMIQKSMNPRAGSLKRSRLTNLSPDSSREEERRPT